MELRHLRYFVTVADTRSFTAAAERLHTAQPSLSRQIRDLENHVGTALFDRSERRIALTPAGQVFLDEARLTLAQAERAVERARTTARDISEQLTVGFDYGLEAGFLAPLTSAIHGTDHVIDLVIRSQPSPIMINDVMEGRLDAAFVLLDGQAKSLNRIVLKQDALLLVVPKRHPLARKARVSVHALPAEQLIIANPRYAPVLHQATLDYGTRQGVRLQATYEADSMMMALSLVGSIAGVCLLPQYSTSVFPKDVTSIQLSGDVPSVAMGLIWHPTNTSRSLQTVLKTFQILATDTPSK